MIAVKNNSSISTTPEDVMVWQTPPEDCDDVIEVTMLSSKPLAKGLKSLSNSSVSTMAPEDHICSLHSVSSSGSVSTMWSDQYDDDEDEDEHEVLEPMTTAGTQHSKPPGVWNPQPTVLSKPTESRHSNVPKTVNLAEEYARNGCAVEPHTLMIRNVPNRYSQRELICELKSLGFGGTFDFLYVPLDLGTMSNVGYAFVNFTESVWAQKCMEVMQNHRFKRHRQAGKTAAVSVAHIQGLEANLKHYEKSAVNTSRLRQRRPVLIANMSSLLA